MQDEGQRVQGADLGSQNAVQKLEDAGCTTWSGDGQNPSVTSLALGSVGFSLGFLFWVANTGFPVIMLMFLPGFGMRWAKLATQLHSGQEHCQGPCGAVPCPMAMGCQQRW